MCEYPPQLCRIPVVCSHMNDDSDLSSQASREARRPTRTRNGGCEPIGSQPPLRLTWPSDHLTLRPPSASDRDGPHGGGLHELRVLAQDAVQARVLRDGPVLAALLELRLRHVQLDAAGGDVDADPVTVADEGDGSAVHG